MGPASRSANPSCNSSKPGVLRTLTRLSSSRRRKRYWTCLRRAGEAIQGDQNWAPIRTGVRWSSGPKLAASAGLKSAGSVTWRRACKIDQPATAGVLEIERTSHVASRKTMPAARPTGAAAISHRAQEFVLVIYFPSALRAADMKASTACETDCRPYATCWPASACAVITAPDAAGSTGSDRAG